MRAYLSKLVPGALPSAALSACVVAAGPGGEVIAYEAPPPVRYEVVGVAPTPGYFWIGGAWFWEGKRWEAHTWHQQGNQWHMAPGHWVSAKR